MDRINYNNKKELVLYEVLYIISFLSLAIEKVFAIRSCMIVQFIHKKIHKNKKTKKLLGVWSKQNCRHYIWL